jgi:protoporphyrinogen IX oxidase
VVRRPVLPAAHLRQPGHGAGHQQQAVALGVLAVATGLWLWLGYGFAGGWLHAKTALVVLLALYHWHCGRVLKAFQSGGNAKSHVWFRFYNELPVIVLLVVLYLVVLKPF